MVKTLNDFTTKTAEELASELRSVSISQFFEKNRHLLGYDNPTKALLTVVKEAVDNSADACEEARIIPEIKVFVKQTAENRYRVIVEDNGPGIVEQQIPKVFAILLYGSKFHRLRQSRGIQGIGISSAVLYSQLTTGKSAKITSKTSSKKLAHYYELYINIDKNKPEIIAKKEIEWDKDHGTRVELELEAKYQKNKQAVDNYLKQTAIVNPHITIFYENPLGENFKFLRVTEKLPKEPKQIKPHPYGVELGILMRMLKSSEKRSLQGFLQSEFSRVSSKVAKEICKKANLLPNANVSRIARQEAESLLKAIREVKIISPATDILSPIGGELLEKGLKKEINADFYKAITRPPNVYRGMPFQIECCMAYGGDLSADEQAKIMRFANRVPLLYQQSAGSVFKAILETNWRNYGLSQSKGALPTGPLVIMVHMASVWVPFTSESKEAIAHYPEIVKEMKLALQECGRQLSIYIRKTVKARQQKEKANLFEGYIPELASNIAQLSDSSKRIIEENLNKILRKSLKDIFKDGKG